MNCKALNSLISSFSEHPQQTLDNLITSAMKEDLGLGPAMLLGGTGFTIACLRCSDAPFHNSKILRVASIVTGISAAATGFFLSFPCFFFHDSIKVNKPDDYGIIKACEEGVICQSSVDRKDRTHYIHPIVLRFDLPECLATIQNLNPESLILFRQNQSAVLVHKTNLGYTVCTTLSTNTTKIYDSSPFMIMDVTSTSTARYFDFGRIQLTIFIIKHFCGLRP